MNENWKKEYAYKFRRPTLKRDDIITYLKQILQDLNTEVRKVKQTSEVNFKIVDEDNFKINLPDSKVIIVNYSEETDNLNFKEKFNLSINNANKSIDIFTKNDCADYIVRYNNIHEHITAVDKYVVIDKSILDDILDTLILITL